MDDMVPFAGPVWCIGLAFLLFARGMDIFSTWIATPNLVLEGNPLVKKMGWKWVLPLNLVLCVGFALWPLPAVVIGTTSILVAARNFQQGWLMQSMGEEPFRDWHVARIRETRPVLYLGCLFAQTSLFALVGVALWFFSADKLIPAGIGMGMVGYALAVAFYTLLSIWRLRRKASGLFY